MKDKTPNDPKKDPEAEAGAVAQAAEQKPEPKPEKKPEPKAEPKPEPEPSVYSFLPSTKTPKKNALTDLTTFIYGRPKSGKSTFASKFPGALFLPFEPGLNHLEVFQAPNDGTGVKSWEHFLTILREINGAIMAGEFPFKTIVIDTVDLAWGACCNALEAKKGVEYVGELGHGKGWTLAGNEFMRVLKGLGQLPVGLVLVSHAKTRTVNEHGEDVEKVVPNLPDSARSKILGFVDVILYVDVVEEKETDEGELVEKTVAFTKPTRLFDAGDRTGKLPNRIPLDFAVFADAVAAAD